jgi:hypothetical protein
VIRFDDAASYVVIAMTKTDFNYTGLCEDMLAPTRRAMAVAMGDERMREIGLVMTGEVSVDDG